uniref:Uncharacterized protein n=1 Tax=Anguilla anguilla TaxID=7936 RepID=A0A0E9RPI7_ANGAN
MRERQRRREREGVMAAASHVIYSLLCKG